VNHFVCNVCGADCHSAAGSSGREVEDCATCKSTVRLRAVVALLSQELFGAGLALPDFPVVRGVRGIGMSDPVELASRLAAKLDYTNTFYHQPPSLDITRPAENDLGRYDFIVSSEVMEHVPVPIEQAFENLSRMLKPDGFLVLTVPYRLGSGIDEHFPELREHALARLGGRTVLVNRRRDGSVEVFENLCFHGGDGSTLEMRVFSEDSLKQLLIAAGFAEVYIASESVPEFGVTHTETWSLPILARKGRFARPTPEVAVAYREACLHAAALARELTTLRGEYDRYIEFHKTSQAEIERQLAERIEWVRKVERDFEERTQWGLDLEKEKNEALAEFKRLQGSELEAWQKVATLERELGEARTALAELRSRLWTRLGHKTGLVK
jgi:SAM-dependent methyltransferase